MASDLGAARRQLESGLGVRDPFLDPGVGEFGLRNAVYEAGDTFLEVVSPVAEDTTAGRYLARHGDAGYMALLQVDDTPATRRRATEMGLRVVWQIDLDDIAGTHLHPRDIGGAIVSFDTAVPTASWRWGGPRWTGGAPDDRLAPGRTITGATVAVAGDPAATARRWASLIDEPVDGCTLALDGGAQRVEFVEEPVADRVGIVEVRLQALGEETEICGVRFVAES